MCKYIKNNQNGLTLLEVLLSLVLLTIIILFFSTMFIQSNLTNSRTESLMDATYVAQKCMEKVVGGTKVDEEPCALDEYLSDHVYAGKVDTYYVVLTVSENTEGNLANVSVFRSKEEKEKGTNPESYIQTILKNP